MDGVLAVGPHRDTEWNQPIYRTFVDPPAEFDSIHAAGVSMHLVTAKVEAEAHQVLEAIGLDRHFASVVGADRLFWPTLWAAARKRRVPEALTKSVCRGILQPQDGMRVVMIEDQAQNLVEMLTAGAIDFGILVPAFTISGERVEQWFDLDLALRIARELATRPVEPSELADLGIELSSFQDANSDVTGTAGALLELPGRSCHRSERPLPQLLASFATDRKLVPSRRNAISIARAGRRLARRMIPDWRKR